MKSLGLVIVDGVGFRNFILSEFLSEADKSFDRVVIYSNIPLDAYAGLIPDSVLLREMDNFPEKRNSWFYRKLKEVAHLKKHDNVFGIRDNHRRGYPKGFSKRKLLVKIAYTLTNMFHSEKNINFFERKQFGTFTNTKYFEEHLKEDNVDILFFTHQRPPYIAPFVVAAQNLKIPTTSFIFSWDNLASKGRMAATFDSYFVWSDLMKDELLHYYPDTKEPDIEVVGTPQFEPYVMEDYERSREDFFKKFEMDPTVKTVCFSCGDISTSPNDEHYISVIADAIEKGKIKEKVNLLVRTSPAEGKERFREIKEKYPFIIWNYPDWELKRTDHAEIWSQRVPNVSDLKDLRSILQFCDLNINMCSTMSLDFILFDKPVINPVLGNGENELFNDQKYLNYLHYKYVVDSKGTAIVKTEEELINTINNDLMSPESRMEAQKELIELEIGKPLKGTSQRMVNTLLNLVEA